MPTYRHIVLFRFYEEVDEESRAAAHHLLSLCAREAGVLSWRLAWSLDTRKGAVLLEEATFASRESFGAWRRTEAHARAGTFLRDVADWLVADVEE